MRWQFLATAQEVLITRWGVTGRVSRKMWHCCKLSNAKFKIKLLASRNCWTFLLGLRFTSSFWQYLINLPQRSMMRFLGIDPSLICLTEMSLILPIFCGKNLKCFSRIALHSAFQKKLWFNFTEPREDFPQEEELVSYCLLKAKSRVF